jgi:hypothetical protein
MQIAAKRAVVVQPSGAAEVGAGLAQSEYGHHEDVLTKVASNVVTTLALAGPDLDALGQKLESWDGSRRGEN